MIRVCVNSQTPPIVPVPGAHPRRRGVWELGRDYTPQVGGVVPMMRALLRAGQGSWIAPRARWVALGAPNLPEEVRTSEGYTLETIRLEAAHRAGYGRFKEAVWRSFHRPQIPEHFDRDYRSFVRYSYLTADRLLQHAGDFDVFYIHDFQQILVGGLIGSSAPTLLRWHIPMDLEGYPEPVRRFFLKSLEGFDAIVVSTRAGLEELIQSGFQGRAFQLYPSIDPSEQKMATDTARGGFRERFGIGDSPFVLSVGRMDPVKRQDLLIDALAILRRRFPDLKLVLAGGGSFSTQSLRAGGADASKATVWTQELRRHARVRKVERHVVFTGSISSDDLQSAYSTATVFAHPAPWEGFGLVVVEAWAHRLPVVVSQGAGVAELVDNDVNGFTVQPGSERALAQKIGELLQRPSAAERMGQVGAMTARRCFVESSAPRERELFERTMRLYETSGLRPRGVPS
ncbi:MAG TPA: glycosyltransferase family 4 protein [Thermoplasmata archaeon]|nr:glycosyltransferase family 4 protein [Thermoplasmata archaeon]